MKILFLTDNFPPEVNAPATRTFEHCKEWVSLGHEVVVITTAPNFPSGKLYDGYKNKIYTVEKIEGIKVVRVLTYITANQGFFRRTLDYLSFMFTSFIASCFIGKIDLIIGTSPQFFTVCSAYLVGFFKRKPWVFELRDLWPESIVSVGAMKKGFIIKLFKRLEFFLYQKAAFIIPNTEAFKNYLLTKGIEEKKIKVIPNGANLDLFFDSIKDPYLLNQLKIENKFVIGYIGTHGLAHSLDFIINSIHKLQHVDIHFLFIGDGAVKSQLVKNASFLKLTNVTFLDSIEKNEVRRYISIIDAALVPLKNSPTFKTVLPSKIFESCAMNKPILLGVDGEARELVEKFNVGLYFKPEDEQDFLYKTLTLVNDKYAYQQYKKNCSTLAKNYDRKKLAYEMINFLHENIKK